MRPFFIPFTEGALLSTQSVIHVSSFAAVPLDHTVVQSLDEIALNDAEEEEDEDPLAEECAFDQDDPLEPTLIDLVEHQDHDDAALDEGRGHRNIVRPDNPSPDYGAAPAPAPVQVPAPAPRAPLPPTINELRARTFRPSTQAARAARKRQDGLELTAFAVTHHNLLQRDEEQIFNLTIADAFKDYGLKPVEDAIKSEISSLITDTVLSNHAGPRVSTFRCTLSSDINSVPKDQGSYRHWRQPPAS